MPLLSLYKASGEPSPTALWQRAYLGDRLQADDLPAIRALADATGGGQDYDFDFKSESWPPSYCGFRQEDNYELVLQGTSNIRQVLLHLGGTILTSPVPDDAFVNKYWGDQAEAFFSRATQYIMGKPTPARVVVSGHSYGGGVASILALRLVDALGPDRVQLVTYGGPRWGSGERFRGTAGQDIRVVNVGDIVPRLPPQLAVPAKADEVLLGLTPFGKSVAWKHRGHRVGVNDRGDIEIGGKNQEEANSIPNIALNYAGPAHLIGTYRARLELYGGIAYPDGWVDGAPGPQVPSVGRQIDAVPAQPLDSAGVADANRLYYGAPQGPITVENQAQWQTGGLIAGNPQVRFSADIREGVSSVAVTPAFSKVTLIINNGIHGHAESHVVNIPITDKSTLYSATGALLRLRSDLLGNGSQAAVDFPSPKSPKIMYVRFTDAQNPRVGFLGNYEKANFFGPLATAATGFEAEAMMKAITLRLTGQNAGPPATSKNTTLQLVGFLDDAAEGYQFNPQKLDAAGQKIGDRIKNYWDYLSSSVGNVRWGFMGASPAINPVPPTPAMSIASFVPTVAPAAANWIVTTQAVNGILAGDRVRIRGANSVFNGVWTVEPYGALGTQFIFKKPPVSGHTAPNGGVVYRLQSGGQALTAFYPYALRDQAFPPDNAGSVVCRVSKHDPGKQWLPYSFSRKIRRER